MKRKVIQIGESTQLISIPRKWAKRNNIKKGEEIDIQEANNKLVLSTEKGNQLKKIKVNFADFNKRLVTWALSTLYKLGYDELEIDFTDKRCLTRIQEVIKKGDFPGFEVMEQSEKKCNIRIISHAKEGEFQSILNRIFLVTISLAKSTLEAIKKDKIKELEETLILEETNNKLTNFCQRILNQSGYEKANKTVFMYLIVWQIENIADQYRYLSKDLLELKEKGKKIKIEKETIEMFEETNVTLEKFYKVFYKYKSKEVLDATTKLIELANKGKEMIKTGNEESNILVRYLLIIIQQTKDILPSLMAVNFTETDE